MVPFVSLKEGGWAIISMSVRACHSTVTLPPFEDEDGVLSCPLPSGGSRSSLAAASQQEAKVPK